MNSTAASAQQGQLPDIKTLIKPEHIRQLSTPRFPEDQREKYIDGVTKIWNILDNQNPNTEEYRKAHEKLASVTMNIKATMQRPPNPSAAGSQQAIASAQNNGLRPLNAGQPGQQDVRPPNQNTQTAAPSQDAPQQFSQRVIDEVKKLSIVAPPNLNGNIDAMKAWIRDAQGKYAMSLHRLEGASKKITTLHQAASARQNQGKPLEQREHENYRNHVARLEQTQRESKQMLQGFAMQQETYKRQGGSVGGLPASMQVGSSGTQHSDGSAGPPKIKQEPPGPAHTVSSAVDAARNQANLSTGSVINPHNTGQTTAPSNTQPPTSRPQVNQTPTSHAHPAFNLNATSRPQDQHQSSPQVAPSQPSLASTMPREQAFPLSHSAAVEQARSSTQQNLTQQTPQSAAQGSSDQRNQNNHSKMPIPKDINIPPPQPVSVGPSRPTLTNGPMAMGPMGQPAIAKHPGYVLEGEGERVLSKKKLEELVRQVTGGTGGEGDESEGLTAEVEETLLQVADDFVDQVIVAACRVAKIRQSSTLELRDLQLILERNYNIRVPGYASDELRTVRKVAPTTGWTQKLSAVQAAKVTGGKGEL